MKDLYVRENTDVEEVIEFFEERVANPYVKVDDRGETNYVWNFSSHELDKDGLRLGYRDNNEFVIPFQVRSVWAVMYALLPEEMKRMDPLIYNPELKKYIAYKQFYDEMSPERFEQLQYSTARMFEEVYDE